MQISQKGLDLIKEFEGLRLTSYLCPAKVWTIGYGTTSGVTKGMVITKERAEELLRQDLRKLEDSVTRLAKLKINQHQFDALASFAYNVGSGALASSTLLRLLNAGDCEGAAAQFERWDKADGRTLAGLTRRRKAERALFEGKA